MMPIRPTVCAALLLLSTACGGGDEDRSTARDSAAAALPSVEEAAMGEVHDPAQAADTTLTLHHHGFGPLRVGMTAAEAEAALGHFRLIPFNPGAPADSTACGYAASVRLPEGVKVMMEGA